MSQIVNSRKVKALSAFLLSVSIVIVNAIPAWAVETPIAPGEDATQRIIATKTERKWFFWPGWLFVALLILVIATMGYAYYKSVLGPKYRGRKVVQ